MTNAIVLTNTPIILIDEIILIALTDFFEKRYRFAKNKGSFMIYALINGFVLFSSPTVVVGPCPG
jgi:hypothetical protein